LANISWQEVRSEVLRKIEAQEWRRGELIPGEMELAATFGCARVTVNRALRQLSEEGFVNRKRKAGTRVALNRVQKATLNIPVIREEIEAAGKRYHHEILKKQMVSRPTGFASEMWVAENHKLLHLRTMHFADKKPYVYEVRWVNPSTVPRIVDMDFEQLSANEWLVQNIPVTNSKFAFTAIKLKKSDAKLLRAEPGDAALCVERATWNLSGPITSVRLTFKPGHKLQSMI
jgi:GntR family histidine utilization transcriptional repressor